MLVDADVVETVDQVTRGEVGIVGRTPDARTSKWDKSNDYLCDLEALLHGHVRGARSTACRTHGAAGPRLTLVTPERTTREVSRCFSSRRAAKPSSVSSIACENSVRRTSGIFATMTAVWSGVRLPRDVDRNWRARWAEEHTQIWAAHQPSLFIKLYPCRLINPVEAACALLLY